MPTKTLEEIAHIIASISKHWIFAPHPDDEVLGTGGIIAKYPSKFFVFCLTDGGGGKSTVASNEEQRKSLVQQRKANDVLGLDVLRSHKCLYLNHRAIKSQTERGSARRDIEALIAIGKPETILLPSPYENSREVLTHRIATELLVEVARQFHQGTELKLYGYEVWDNIPKGPSITIEDISEQIDTVKAAMAVHNTETAMNFIRLKEARAISAALWRNLPPEFKYGEKFLDMTCMLYERISLDDYCASRKPEDYDSNQVKLNPFNELKGGQK